jgi:hypothetical protein
MSKKKLRQRSRRHAGTRAGEGTRRPAWVVDGGGEARKRPYMPAHGGHAPANKIYSHARVEHTSECGGWIGWFLVADDGKDDLEPSGEACVHQRLPEIMRIDFEKKYIYPKISKRMRNPDLEWLKITTKNPIFTNGQLLTCQDH